MVFVLTITIKNIEILFRKRIASVQETQTSHGIISANKRYETSSWKHSLFDGNSCKSGNFCIHIQDLKITHAVAIPSVSRNSIVQFLFRVLSHVLLL